MCDAGYYGSSNTSCEACSSNFYCPGDLPVSPELPCQEHSNSPVLSSSKDQCICDAGFFSSNKSSYTCQPCSSWNCSNGIYRSSCTLSPFPVPDIDSTCDFPCSIPSDNPNAYTWTSSGGYSSVDYKGVDNCSFDCGTGYHRQNNSEYSPPMDICVLCNQNPASCPIGQFLNVSSGACDPLKHQDSQCQACTNKPLVHSTYTMFGPLNSNNCTWECDLGYFLDSSTGICKPCSTGPPCRPLGTYRSQCIRGGSHSMGSDSSCTLQCTGELSETVGYIWKSPGSYDYVNFKGNNDCTFQCDFQGGVGYYEQNNSACIKITARNGTCGIGMYTVPATITQDTYCSACFNYPSGFTGNDVFNGSNGKFRWHSSASYEDPYGILDQKNCEFECFEGINSVYGWYFDITFPHVLGSFGGFPTSGTCSPCISTECPTLGQYRGVCQATGHSDPGTCVNCVHKKVANSIPVGWYYTYPGQFSLVLFCLFEPSVSETYILYVFTQVKIHANLYVFLVITTSTVVPNVFHVQWILPLAQPPDSTWIP